VAFFKESEQARHTARIVPQSALSLPGKRRGFTRKMMTKIFSNRVNKQTMILAALAVATLSTAALAGGGGAQQFGTLANELQSWAQGALGIVISIAALLVGLSIGVVKQSLMAVVTGIGIAIALYFGPTVITGVLNAGGAFQSLPALVSASVPVF
jgi:conjugal transfer pilus assembly protein TraA